MESLSFLLLAAFLVGYGLVSGRIARSVLSGPILFTAFGLLVAMLPLGAERVALEAEWLNVLAELTLVLVLFSDASRIDIRQLRDQHRIPVRLLAIGLPLTVVAGVLAGAWLLPALTLLEITVLAIVLAPTDAALGQAVVSSPQVPVRIRQALNVESGLNDGIALPFLLMFLALLGVTEDPRDLAYWARFALLQLGLGPLVGVVVGWIGGGLIQRGTDRGWVAPSFQRLSSLGLALLAYAGAGLLGGNGFIAAFCAGLTLAYSAGTVCHRLVEFAEAEGQLLTLLTFMFFGSLMVIPAIEAATPASWLYAALSLTLIRMLPVTVSLLGMRLQPATVGFLGWFGPRGIASILYALLVLRTVDFPGRDAIFQITVLTVMISIVAHGVSAWPISILYARRLEPMMGEPDVPEAMAVPEMPTRYGK